MRAWLMATAVVMATGQALPAAAGARLPEPRARPVQTADLAARPKAIGIRIAPRPAPRDPDLPFRLGTPAEQTRDPLKGAHVSFGPLRARLGGTATRAHFARYKLEGMDVLGGSVSGTFDGRGARLYVRWPPSDDD